MIIKKSHSSNYVVVEVLFLHVFVLKPFKLPSMHVATSAGKAINSSGRSSATEVPQDM